MSRFARRRRVLFVEEPVYERVREPVLRLRAPTAGLQIAVPVLPDGLTAREAVQTQRMLLAEPISRMAEAGPPTFWFQTPMAVPIAPMERAGAVVYDCMDELTAFQDAPPALVFNERQLFSRADLVFAGGRALYEAKSLKHASVHCFPSGIDVAHFARARGHQHGPSCTETARALPPGPRAGFCGVIDERLDTDLLGAVARLRPEMQFVMVGPVVKIDPATLPQADNIHYLGMRDYLDLPDEMAEWDVALMPFARNDATRYISPTKTPEYLAAGLPVVSTGITDVVRSYGADGLVSIADDPAGFAREIDRALRTASDARRLRRVDAALEGLSWDGVWERMAALEDAAATRVRAGDAFERKTPAEAR